MRTKRITLMMAGLLLASGAQAFQETWSRYLAKQDVFRVLRSAFPLSVQADLGKDCTRMTDANRLILGQTDRDTGQPIYSAPSAGFLNWYSECARKMVDAEVEARSKAAGGLSVYLTGTQNTEMQPSQPWAEISESDRLRIAANVLENILGKNVASDLETCSRNMLTVISWDESSHPTLSAGIKKLMLATVLQDEFLRY